MTPPNPLTELSDRVQALTSACREMDALVVVALDLRPCWLKQAGGSLWIDMRDADLISVRFTDDGMKRSRGNPPIGDFPELTKSIDAAMAILPATIINHDLFSFGGHGEKHITGLAWGFKCHDTAQLVGAKRAAAEVSRLMKSPALKGFHGEPRLVLTRAIAEQFMEFSSTHAATPAAAIVATALRARAALENSHD